MEDEKTHLVPDSMIDLNRHNPNGLTTMDKCIGLRFIELIVALLLQPVRLTVRLNRPRVTKVTSAFIVALSAG
jgi:hypothetical protein